MSERLWPIHDARNKFSELVERAVQGEPQVVTKRGKRTAVLVSAAEYARLKGRSSVTQPRDFVEHMRNAPKGTFTAPPRRKSDLRRVEFG